MRRPHLFALLLTACDATPSATADRSTCTLAVVASDYRSTAISLLADDGTLCAPDILTSGSRPPGLLTALSGDIALPSAPSPDGLLRLIDRYPNAVLTTLDPLTSAVLEQTRLSPDFASNPQDLAPTAIGLLVSRLERASNAIDAPGSDLLLLPSDAAASTLSLAPYADPGIDPMPTRMAKAHGLLWVGLTHLSRDWSKAGPGRVLGLSDTLEITHTVDLSPLQNCGHIAAPADGSALWVVCSGLFRNTGLQLAHSGVAVLDAPTISPDSIPSPPAWTALAEPLIGRPLGFSIAALDQDRAFVIALGSLEDGTPDSLVLIDRRGNLATRIATGTGGPFELSGLFIRYDILLVADADPRTPRLRRFRLADTPEAITELAPILVSPSGLPPRAIHALR